MAMTILLQQPSCAATFVTFSRCRASKVDPRIISQLKHDRSFVPKHKPSRLGDFNAGFDQIRRNMKNVVVHASVPPEVPSPIDPSPAHCAVGLLGTTVAILLSLFQGKWGPLRKLIGKVDTTIEELEEISDMVEEAAERVDKVEEAAAKHLPDGKLQDAAEFVEKLAERIDEHAELAGDVLEQVDSFLDSATDQEKTVVSGEASDQE